MMQIHNLIIDRDSEPLSFDIAMHKTTVICSLEDDMITLILRKISGMDDLEEREGISGHSFSAKDIGYQLAFIFKTGIMLANLNLRENISLPFRYFYPRDQWGVFEERLRYWMDFFSLKVDLNLRPAMINVSERKILSCIRSLIMEPRIYIFDSPLFQITHKYRKKIIDCLASLKDSNRTLIIGTSDFDLIATVAQEVIVVDKQNLKYQYKLDATNREEYLAKVKKYLDENQL